MVANCCKACHVSKFVHLFSTLSLHSSFLSEYHLPKIAIKIKYERQLLQEEVG